MGLFPLRDAERRGRDTNTTTVLGLVSLACALAGAPRVCRGLDLAPHFAAAESFVAAGNYGPAIREYHKIIYQTDDALPRDRARFGIGQCHFFSHDYEQARRALRQLADDGKGEWAAAAQLLIAEILIQEAKYSAAMNELQRLVAEHPQTPQANRAYFLIGKRLFDLGRFDEAAGAIERVGTAFAAGEHGALSVEPGEPVFVQLVDADLYLGENHPGIEIEITSDRGEREKARLRPLAAGRGVLMASLPTALGDPVPGDGTISVCGTDVLTVRYTDDVTAAGNRGVARESKLRVASNALLQICSEDGSQPVDFLLLDGRATIRVRDPDCDVSAERDRVRIEIASADGARKEIELLESAAHSGIFEALVVAASTNAAPSAASVPARNGDRIEIRYEDQRRSSLSAPRKTVVARVDVVSSTEGTVRSLGDLAREEVLEKLTAIERGKSYLIIGRAHDHIGLRDDALDYFRRAQREFQYVLDHVPPGSDEEAEALQMSWKTHLEQANYNAAFATCLRILKSGRDTSVGVDALFRLATEVEQKNPRQAALYYRKLVDEFPRNPVAAQAQYRLAAARKREGARNPGLRSECASEFQRLIELFPDSEHVPEALSFVTQHALDTGDYERALDFATRLSSSYAATSFVEEGVMAQGKALLKLGRAREASALFKKALFDNPEARGELEPLLQEAEAKLAAPAESAATKEKK